MFSCRAFPKRGNVVRIKTRNKGLLISQAEINHSSGDLRSVKSCQCSIKPSAL